MKLMNSHDTKIRKIRNWINISCAQKGQFEIHVHQGPFVHKMSDDG